MGSVPDAIPAPPSNMEAEESLIGALLVNREAIGKVAAFLKPSHFYRERHSTVFAALLELWTKGEPLDFVTLCDSLERSGKLQEVGGASYIGSLVNAAPTAAHAEHYGRLVERAAVRRGVIRVATQAVQRAYEESDPEVVISEVETLLYDLRHGRNSGRLIMPVDRVNLAYSRLEAAQRGERLGIPWGFLDLDHWTAGAHPGEFIIPAARPSMGKTSWMHAAAERQCRQGYHVLWCSAEQPERQLTDRYLASATECSVHDIEDGRLTEDQWTKVSEALGKAVEALPVVYDDADMTTGTIRAMASEMRGKVGLDIIYVDYIQKLHDRARDDEVQRVTGISRNLKTLARAFNVPVVAASQLNRMVESRQDRKPTLSDLRESGALEQDADVVVLLYRPEYYFPDGEVKYRQQVPDDKSLPWRHACHFIVAKQRNGPRGVVVPLWFNAGTLEWGNYATAPYGNEGMRAA